MLRNRPLSIVIGLTYTATIVFVVAVSIIKDYTEIVIPSIIALCAASISLVVGKIDTRGQK